LKGTEVTMGGARHGGVVFRTGEELHFLPASVAIKVVPEPEVARVPGAPPEILGAALVDGEPVLVVDAGDARGALLVVSFLGERIALAGVEVLATGRFEALPESLHGEHVVYEGRVARVFDVAAVVAGMREGR
jgi:hypothetical protein